jgi:nitroimidazol reductase NimA-like FMN-containing flavoprotein (pyridoxamine 5'-phosphate oxidase superfamily)
MARPKVARPAAAAADRFTRVRRVPELAHYDLTVLHDILDAATHCHIAHVVDGRPVATPTLHWRIDDHVYWHGSVASRMVKAALASPGVCLTATLIDGWVLARSAFNHSVNYRSAMCFGQPELVADPAEKARVLEVFTERLFPGRWGQLRPMTRKELGATAILRLALDAASAKVRTGPPDDPARDCDWPVWAGTIPLTTREGRAVPAPGLKGKHSPPKRPRRPRVRA